MERNNHHLWFTKKWYKSPLDKRFRNYPGFIVNMPVSDHRELHEAIKPPIKPAPWLMHVILEQLKIDEVSVADTIPATIDILEQYAQRSRYEEEQGRIRKMGANILAQYEFAFNAIEENQIIA